MPLLPDSSATHAHDAQVRLWTALVSVVAALLILGVKLAAWQLTGSTAMLSDALESIVNVIASAFAAFSVRLASQPGDALHPFGLGKMEYVSALFEGGLVVLAAVWIIVAGVQGLVVGVQLRALDVGLLVCGGAALVNLLLGWWVVRRGRALNSAALVADGHHVLSDVWTTGAVLLGVGLVHLTGWQWLDPLTALGAGGMVAFTGVRLVRESADRLLDRQDPEALRTLREAFATLDLEGLQGPPRIHAWRLGAQLRVELHAHVPADWSVARAAATARTVERALQEATGLPGHFRVHLGPPP